MDFLTLVLIILGSVAVIAVILLVVVTIATRKSLIRLTNACDKEYDKLEFLLDKRYELISKLINKTCTSLDLPAEKFDSLQKARDIAFSQRGVDKAVLNEKMMLDELCLFEEFVKKNDTLLQKEEFNSLYAEYIKNEEDILYAKSYYNAFAKRYNLKIKVFPANIMAKSQNYEKKSIFTNRDEVN